MMIRPALLLAAALALAAPARANDSTAEIGAGGLIFLVNESVSMEHEELFVSPTEVRVDYRFLNTTDQELDFTVAFPMPDIDGNPFLPVSIPNPDDDNFLGFTVTVDGKPVAVNLQQRAFVAGIDITQTLGDAGVPSMPFAESTRKAIAALPQETLDAWIRQGILVKDTYDIGKGMEDHYEPYWTLKTTYYWDMTFPAGREVAVSHRYTPSLGGTAGLTFIEDGKLQGWQYQDYKARYCLDGDFAKSVAKFVTPEDPYGSGLTESRLSYILVTGRNWQGTIKSFRLTVDKGAPENLVSFCGEGVTKTGPTTFVMEKTDFWPERDLDILIVNRQPN